MSEGTSTPDRRHLGIGAGVGLLLAWMAASFVGAFLGTLLTGVQDDPYSEPLKTLGHVGFAPLAGLVLLVVVVSTLRWWPVVLREAHHYRSWGWLFPVAMVVTAALSADWGRVADAGGALVLALAASVLLIAASEELMFRGVLLQVARDRWSEGVAALVVTLVFGLAHYAVGGFGSIVVLISTLLGGYLYYVVRRVTGLLVGVIAVHAWWDFCIFSNALGPGESPGNALAALLAMLVLVVAAVVGRRWLEPEPV